MPEPVFSPTDTSTSRRTAIYPWELLVLLWLAFFFNQADRQIFNVVLPLIKTDLGLSDAQLGLVASVFVFTIGVFIPVAGVAGDLYNRKTIICLSLLFWSGATLFTGMSSTVTHLILLRSIAVGGGEAFYAPAANALIGEYHQKTRALAMAIHQTSLYAGVILSGFLGAWISERYGWHVTFYLFGGVGIGLAGVLALRLKSAPAPGRAEGVEALRKISFLKASLTHLWGKPTARLLTLAFAGMVFVNVGYLTWMPTFLHEKFSLSLSGAGFSSMFYHHAAAFAGVLLGGRLSDRLAQTRPGGRMLVQAGALLAGVPFIVGMGQSADLHLTYFFLAGFGLFRGVYDANLYATLFDVIEPRYRATAAGFMSMFAFLAGAASPVLLGYLKPTLGLSDGLSALSGAYLLGGLCILAAARWFLRKDLIAPRT